MVWTGWVLSVLPAPLLVMSGISKITLSPEVVKGFGDMGWTTDAAMVLAVLELGSLLLYLIPQTAVLGAILLTGYLGGAAPPMFASPTTAIAGFRSRWASCCGSACFLRDARLRSS